MANGLLGLPSSLIHIYIYILRKLCQPNRTLSSPISMCARDGHLGDEMNFARYVDSGTHLLVCAE